VGFVWLQPQASLRYLSFIAAERDGYNRGMTHGDDNLSRWRFTIGGTLFVTSGIAASLAFLRFASSDHPESAAGVAAGLFCLGGTIGGVIAHFCYGTERAAANGFVLGGVLGIVIGGCVLGAIFNVNL
jgi:hypothetical protein